MSLTLTTCPRCGAFTASSSFAPALCETCQAKEGRHAQHHRQDHLLRRQPAVRPGTRSGAVAAQPTERVASLYSVSYDWRAAWFEGAMIVARAIGLILLLAVLGPTVDAMGVGR